MAAVKPGAETDLDEPGGFTAARTARPGLKRLRYALALTTCSEAITSLKDAASLDDDDEIISTLEWATSALLPTALRDFEGSQ